jgi:shikimate kinase
MRVFLIGLPGVGKTTLGPDLASALVLPFFDLDELLTKRYGLTPSEQLKLVGNDRFRWREAAELRRWISQIPNGLLACGGGTPVYLGGIFLMKAYGVVVWLDLEVQSWLKRVCAISDRPLLQGVDGKINTQKALELRRDREEIYSQAHIRLLAPCEYGRPEWVQHSAQEVKRAADEM